MLAASNRSEMKFMIVWALSVKRYEQIKLQGKRVNSVTTSTHHHHHQHHHHLNDDDAINLENLPIAYPVVNCPSFNLVRILCFIRTVTHITSMIEQ